MPDELLPPRQHLAAQQRAVGGGLGDRGGGAVVGLVGVLAQPAYGVGLLGGGVGDLVRTTGERAHGAVEGLLHDGRARLLVVGQGLEPLPDLEDGRGLQQPHLGDLALLDGEQRGVLEAAAGEHPREVGGDGLDGVGRRPVQHDGDGGRALGRLAQEVPRHLVGVARRRGDEEPEVGGREQLGGEDAVALLDGVDVGRVEDRQPGRHRRRGHQLQGSGVVGLAGDALEVGQEALLAEPLRVVGVVHQHGRAGRRAQHARGGDAGADERVDQGRLPGPGRAADDRQQRRVERHQAGDDVVLELVDHLRARRALLVRARQLERELHVLEGAAHPHEGGHHRGRGLGRVTPGGRGAGLLLGHRVGTTCPGKEM